MELWKRLRQWSHLWFDEFRQRLEQMVDEWRVLSYSATPYLFRESLIFLFQIGCCPNPRPVSVISEASDFGLPSYTCVRTVDSAIVKESAEKGKSGLFYPSGEHCGDRLPGRVP